MSNKTVAQRIKTLLNGNPELAPLLDNIQTLTSMQRHLDSVIPPHLANTCQVLGLKFGTLTIAASNSTIAAKLRQLAPELVTLLTSRGCQISGIRVKAQVSYDVARPKNTARKLGKGARQALNELSESMEDSPLRSVLQKIAGKD